MQIENYLFEKDRITFDINNEKYVYQFIDNFSVNISYILIDVLIWNRSDYKLEYDDDMNIIFKFTYIDNNYYEIVLKNNINNKTKSIKTIDARNDIHSNTIHIGEKYFINNIKKEQYHDGSVCSRFLINKKLYNTLAPITHYELSFEYLCNSKFNWKIYEISKNGFYDKKCKHTQLPYLNIIINSKIKMLFCKKCDYSNKIIIMFELLGNGYFETFFKNIDNVVGGTNYYYYECSLDKSFLDIFTLKYTKSLFSSTVTIKISNIIKNDNQSMIEIITI
jgi:hypothetical protein